MSKPLQNDFGTITLFHNYRKPISELFGNFFATAWKSFEIFKDLWELITTCIDQGL